MLTDAGRTLDAGVTGILLAHLGAFGSGELKRKPTKLSEYDQEIETTDSAVGFLLHRYSITYTVESLSLFYLLIIS